MKLFFSNFILAFILYSCTTSPQVYENFVSCENQNTEFTKLYECGLEKIKASCQEQMDCKTYDDRFLKKIRQLNKMTQEKEISENEAMFRYLQIIDSLESRRQEKFNHSYRGNHNIRYLGYPFSYSRSFYKCYDPYNICY